MKWNKFTIQTTTKAEDFISAMLSELGIEGVEIENNVPLTKEEQSDMFIDFLPELPPDEGISYVSFYLEDGKEHSALLQRVAQTPAPISRRPGSTRRVSPRGRETAPAVAMAR